MVVKRTDDQFLLDAYSGLGGFASGAYLVQHPRESDKKYQRRRELAVYPNFVRKVVNNYLGFLWRRTPTRDTDELYARFSENADGAGHDINHVMLSYQRLAMILGTVYVIVDRPMVEAKTRAEEPLPYLSVRLPGQLASYALDASGRFTSVTFEEKYEDATLFRTFTPRGWMISEDAEQTKVIDRGEYRLGRVPVVPLWSSQPLNPTDVRGYSWVFDLAQLNWDLYNLYSELRELFRAQTFAILALPVSDATERERLQDMTISTENAITYDPQGGGKPAFIAPPDGPVSLYMDQIARVVADIYQVANLEFVGGVQQSGVALSFRFQEMNTALMTLADLAERAEVEIAELVYAWMGREWSGNIAYRRDFNINDLAQELALAMDAVTLDISPAFDRELKKRLARQILGEDLAPSKMAQILEEIDAQGDVYGDRVARQAGG